MYAHWDEVEEGHCMFIGMKWRRPLCCMYVHWDEVEEGHCVVCMFIGMKWRRAIVCSLG